MTDGGTCPACGEDVPAGTQFCTSCGTYLGWGDRGPSPETTAPTARIEPAAAPAVPTDGTRPLPPVTTPVEPARWVLPPTRGSEAAASVPSARAGTPATALRDDAATTRCPACATTNDAHRRFCRKCGTFIGTPSERPVAGPSRRLPWWRRWVRRRSPAERRARRSYRRSLPLWIRLRRWLVALLVIALAWAYLAFIGRSPVAWVKDRVYALRGTLVAVPDLRASTYPTTTDPNASLAAKAVDGDPTTPWTTLYEGPVAVANACEVSGARSALVLTAKRAFTARALAYQAPSADQTRLANWRPTKLGLLFDDGTCRIVDVRDAAGRQVIKFSAKKTLSLTITVIAATGPAPGFNSNRALIAEAGPMQRPTT